MQSVYLVLLDAKLKVKVKSVHIVVLVFFLPRTITGFAHSNSALGRDKVSRAPHLGRIIERERSATKLLVCKSLTGLDCARNFTGARFLVSRSTFGGLGFVFAGLGFESHESPNLNRFKKLRVSLLGAFSEFYQKTFNQSKEPTERNLGDICD